MPGVFLLLERLKYKKNPGIHHAPSPGLSLSLHPPLSPSPTHLRPHCDDDWRVPGHSFGPALRVGLQQAVEEAHKLDHAVVGGALDGGGG